jgi:nucleoside phosphorylase
MTNILELNVPLAKIGTGSSFATPEGNIKMQHDENEVAIKEMECAAIAGTLLFSLFSTGIISVEVADMFSIPFLAIKGVTDYVDVHVEISALNSEFSANLGPVSDIVAETSVHVVKFMMGKKLEHL